MMRIMPFIQIFLIIIQLLQVHAGCAIPEGCMCAPGEPDCNTYTLAMIASSQICDVSCRCVRPTGEGGCAEWEDKCNFSCAKPVQMILPEVLRGNGTNSSAVLDNVPVTSLGGSVTGSCTCCPMKCTGSVEYTF